jgi:DNA-binding CsgD family transcriptional regulator
VPPSTPAVVTVVVVLTPRELEILDLVSRPGGSRKEAACALGISKHTVDHHLTIVYAKLGVDNVGAAARRLGQLETGQSPR